MQDAGKATKAIRRTRNVCYWSLLALLIFVTVLHAVFYYDDIAVFCYIASSLSIGSGVYLWCLFDSRARGFRLTTGMMYGIAFVGPIVVPVYFVRTRGMKQAMHSIFGLMLYVPFYGAFYATWYATISVLVAAGYYA